MLSQKSRIYYMNNNENSSNRSILVTGGLGFIGFNAIQQWRDATNWKIVVVDCETYAARFRLEEKKEWCKDRRIDVEYVDISEPTHYNFPTRDGTNHLEEIIKIYNIDTIVNFAAESHVDNSISGPYVFFKTNVMGTVNLLELARKYNLRFHQISTDEVYGITYPTDSSDANALKPSSPYSSSKASADLIALSYYKTFGLNVTISRCSNNFGPWQHPEKLIPTIFRCLQDDKPIPVYGNGNQYRQWISVHDHNTAVRDIIENGIPGKIYNISSNDAGYMTNLQLIEKICKLAGKNVEDSIQHVTDRPGHDTSYYIYNMGKMPLIVRSTIDKQLEETFNWYMEKL